MLLEEKLLFKINSNHFKKFLYYLLDNAKVYFFGGVVRAYLDNQLQDLPRDIDIVVEFNKANDKIDKYIPSTIYHTKNRFKGYKISFENITVDIWELKNTWAFQQRLIEPKAENLLKTVFLNIDAVVYYINKSEFLDHCDVKYRRLKDIGILDIVMIDNPFIELNLLRAIIYKKKYNLNYSNHLVELFSVYIKNKYVSTKKLIELQQEHFNQILITQEEINKELGFYNE